MNSRRDDTFTLDLPGSNIQFTRYLYIKDEVRAALLVSLLNKSDDAIFWAYELYCSGFIYELIDLIWKIYYDFYAVLNPLFEEYLNKKLIQLHTSIVSHKNNSRCKRKPVIITVIIQDLLIRPFTTDIFLFRTINNYFEINCDQIITETSVESQISNWLKIKNYTSICFYVINATNLAELLNVYELIVNYYIISPSLVQKYIDDIKISYNTIILNVNMLSKVVSLFNSGGNIPKSQFYIRSTVQDISDYQTYLPYSGAVLEEVTSCSVDKFAMLGLFNLQRCKYKRSELLEMYNCNWLYHASFSPVWRDRLKRYRGYPNYITKTVEFLSENDLTDFYDKYDYEPDEQLMVVKERSLMKIKPFCWVKFSSLFSNGNILTIPNEEIESLNSELLSCY